MGETCSYADRPSAAFAKSFPALEPSVPAHTRLAQDRWGDYHRWAHRPALPHVARSRLLSRSLHSSVPDTSVRQSRLRLCSRRFVLRFAVDLLARLADVDAALEVSAVFDRDALRHDV